MKNMSKREIAENIVRRIPDPDLDGARELMEFSNGNFKIIEQYIAEHFITGEDYRYFHKDNIDERTLSWMVTHIYLDGVLKLRDYLEKQATEKAERHALDRIFKKTAGLNEGTK